MLPTLASNSLDQMLTARRDDQPNFYQLYVNQNRELTRKMIQQAEQVTGRPAVGGASSPAGWLQRAVRDCGCTAAWTEGERHAHQDDAR